MRYAAFALLLTSNLAFSQNTITTLAGTDWVFPKEVKRALEAPFGTVYSVAIGPGAVPYFADSDNQRIFKLSADGTFSVVAGNGSAGFSGDGGPALSAALNSPRGLSFDGQGNLYFLDGQNPRLRRVTFGGTITTIAGTGQAGFSGDDGPALRASLSAWAPATAVDRDGNVYIADTSNRRVRQIAPDGIIRTVAGNGQPGSTGDGGPPASASMGPTALAFDTAGSLYIGDGARVRVVSPEGIIAPYAGNVESGYAGDGGPARSALLGQVRCLAFDNAGNLYIGDSNWVVRKVTPEGIISTVAGNGTPTFSGDGGPATRASLQLPLGLAADQDGNLFVADGSSYRLRKVASSQTITTVAGNGAFRRSGDGGPAVSATLNLPTSVALDAAGNIYVVEISGNRVRKITPFGVISTFAGAGTQGYAGDGGPATAALLTRPYFVAVDPAGNVLIADSGNFRIRKVTSAGIITTVVGTGRAGYDGDGGPATAASINYTSAVAFDSAGNMYLADSGNNVIRKVDTRGTITTVAGNGQAGFSGDGGLATQATLNSPFAVAVGPGGNLYISDEGNLRVRMVNSAGVISTIAGNGRPGYSGDGGPPWEASFSSMDDIKLDASGNIYLATGDNAVRMIGTDGTVSTVAGTGLPGLSGDGGPATRAQLNYPGGVAIDARGNLYIAERLNHRVRMVQSTPPGSIALSQTGLTFTTAVGGNILPQSFNVINNGQGSMNWTATASVIGGGPSWITLTPDRGSSVARSTAPSVEVRVNPAGLETGDYYALVQVSAPGVPNSPQFITVVLNMVGAEKAAGAAVQPTGLLFLGTEGGAAAATQSVQVSNLTSRDLRYSSSIAFGEGRNWLTYSPASGAIAGGQSVRINVQPALTGLAAGAYTASLTLSFTGNTTQGVSMLLVVRSPGSPSARKQIEKPAAAACSPAKLLLLSTLLGNGFSALAGWPVPLEVRVVDSCGTPLLTGSVGATFSNNDPPLQLRPVFEGRWAGTWQARNPASVTVSLKAQQPEPKLEGTMQIAGNLQVNPNPPVIATDGVLNAASFQLKAPIAPGGLVSIFGSKLATELRKAEELPLATEMAGTVGLIAGRPLPLLFTSDLQVNAMIPYDLTTGVTHQMLIQRQRSISLPEPVVIAPAQPAIFTKERTGKGQAIAVGVAPDGAQYLVEQDSPLQEGHAVVLYCAGLGPVSPSVPEGAAAPLEPLSQTSNPVTLTIGGQQATVLFAGLAPGFAGLYQVNALVPEGIEKGPEVPVVLTLAGQPSPPVTLPIQ